jgi:O-antigen/teichoic acid export membrane protein
LKLFGKIKPLFHAGMARNISLTMISFVFLAASGVVINLFVVAARDSAALGIFNQAYSVYIVVSQFAVFGLHYSVMRSAAFHEHDPAELGRVIISAAVPALFMGAAAAILVYFAQPLLERAFDSPQTGRAISVSALGLSLFPLNKVLIGFINGLRHMAAFAVLQAVRYIVVAIVAVSVAFSTLPFENALYCFVAAELLTAIGAIAYIAARRLCEWRLPDIEWIRRHFSFGAKSLAAGIFGEINTRIDVLMLGVFLDDRAVGIYSFAALLLDGLFHVLAMIRVNYNPFLVSALRDGRQAEANELLRKTRVRVPAAMFALSLLVIGAFVVFCTYILPGKDLISGLPSLVILLSSMTLVSGLVPYDNLMLASGRPGYQTIQQICAVLANVIGNLALIPLFGIEGAALGTACGFMIGTLVLLWMSKRMLGWNLLAA